MQHFHSYILVLVFLVVLNSCVIHNKSPFICFRAECVKRELSLKPLKKRITANLNARARRNKKGKNAQTFQTAGSRDIRRNDSISYALGDHIVYTRFLIVFYLKEDAYIRQGIKDSLMVGYTSEYNDMRESDKLRISYCVDQLRPFGVEKIIITEIFNVDNIKEFHYLRVKRRRIVKDYVHREGIPSSIICLVVNGEVQ